MTVYMLMRYVVLSACFNNQSSEMKVFNNQEGTDLSLTVSAYSLITMQELELVKSLNGFSSS